MIHWSAKILGLPELASKNGASVDALIVYVHWLMFALFVGWIIYFGYALWRFNAKRNPRADYDGVKNHFSNYIELIVAGVEALLLVGVAIPVWARAVDHFPDTKNSTVIHIMAQQYLWNVRYPGPDGIFAEEDEDLISDTNVFGVDSDDPHGKDDFQTINEIHVPVNKPVIVYVSSRDVIHSFKLIAMRVCQDAIPGLRIPCWFVPTKIGRYQVNCAQLCGPGHDAMTGGFLIVQSQADYDKWLKSQEKPSAGAIGAGKNPFE